MSHCRTTVECGTYLFCLIVCGYIRPGIMKPNHLKCKNSNGEIVPFGVDGVQWLDGSIQADVPFRRLSSLFSVSNFIVSQVNFHVLPFIDHKVPGKVGKESSLIKNMLSALDLDLRHRSVLLSKMGLLPKLYGHDITNVFRYRHILSASFSFLFTYFLLTIE